MNPQRTYHKFITEAMDMAKDRERNVKHHAQKKETELNKAISRLSENRDLDDTTRSEKLAGLKKELRGIKQENHKWMRCFIAAKDCLEGETVSKYYFQSNKESKLRDIICALITPGTNEANQIHPPVMEDHPTQSNEEAPIPPQPQYKKYSPKMAEMMRDYHGETLQKDGIDVDMEMQESMIKLTISNISAAPSEGEKTQFTLKMKREEVLKPLNMSKNDSAPRINGATNKFHKVPNNRHIEDE
ncbi:hypothetical protein EDD18DRAFT_1348264 [Armillaria luteobubalina]|uniref:Uncharacterized protein n=1 Tax=Armillaria luteobubalina TaxID=153913 RepID=A0AA39QDC7_9AGAR|nr:hypothetical protein EDD18DRAFT_1348264 [Armillaria luteobubalina]